MCWSLVHSNQRHSQLLRGMTFYLWGKRCSPCSQTRALPRILPPIEKCHFWRGWDDQQTLWYYSSLYASLYSSLPYRFPFFSCNRYWTFYHRVCTRHCVALFFKRRIELQFLQFKVDTFEIDTYSEGLKQVKWGFTNYQPKKLLKNN